LLARIYEVLPLVCPRCGGEMRLIVFMTRPTAIGAVLTHLGEPITPPPPAPPLRPACSPSVPLVATPHTPTLAFLLHG
jgi:hypothetical protein